jgi:hypothetical protein
MDVIGQRSGFSWTKFIKNNFFFVTRVCDIHRNGCDVDINEDYIEYIHYNGKDQLQ